MSLEYNTDIIVQQITDEQWCKAAVKLENSHANISEVEATIPRRGWSWSVLRTDVKGVFLKNTYFYGKIITSSSMNVYVECRGLLRTSP